MTTLSAIEQVSIEARDLPRAVAFYRDALGIRHLFDAPPQMSFFECGGIRILVGVAEKPDLAHGSSILYFGVADIDAAYAELKGRGVKFQPGQPHLAARMPGREVWIAFFDYTEGNVMALMCEKAV
jgi:methylmalonyl-CoA/ethylmalonyl-CoA epimerase